MPQKFVRIINRGAYTSLHKAMHYVSRKVAVEHFVGLDGLVLEIWMLESHEIAALRARQTTAARPENIDDGIERRWATRPSQGIGVRQLRPIAEVGTSRAVSKSNDRLIRRQPPRYVRATSSA